MSTRSGGRGGWERYCAALVVGVGLIVLAPLWWRAGVVASRWSDVAAQFLSIKQLAHAALLDGRIALWNGAMNGGAPALGNPQSNALFPIDLALAAFPVERSINLVFVANLLAAGLAMWALARRLVRPAAALFAAIAYMLAWRYVVMIEVGWLPRMSMVALAPLLFLTVRAVIEAPGRRRTIGFGAVVAASLLQGDLQPTYYVAVAALGQAAWLLRGATRERRRHAMLALGGGALLGALVAAPALLPAAQFAALSTRTHGDYAFFLQTPPRPTDLVTLFDPFTGDGARPGFWENNFYFGLFLLPLVAIGLARGGRRARVLGGATLLGILVCFDSPLLRALFLALPGFSLFRQSPRVLLLVQLAVVLIAASGVEVLLDAMAARRRWSIAVAVACCAAPVIDVAARVLPDLTVRPIAEVAPPSPIHADLAAVSARGGRTAAIGRSALPYGQAGWFGIDLVNGYAGLTLRHWIEYWAIMQWGTREAIPRGPIVWTHLKQVARPDLLQALDVERIVADGPFDPAPLDFTPIAHEDDAPAFLFYEGFRALPVDVFAARRPLGPAWFAASVEAVADEAGSLEALLAVRPPRTASVLGLDRPPAIAPDGARAEMVERAIDRFVYRTESGGEGFLVFAQIWYPGWRLRIDGVEAPLYRTNHALIGAFVPAGHHRLELTMTSPALSLGLALCALGVLGGLLLSRRRS